jgi:hypothetical protein
MSGSYADKESLREEVLASFGGGGAEHAMASDELLRLLAAMDAGATSSLDSVRAAIADAGSGAAPSHEQAATLAWLDAAFLLWHRDFPLEPPLDTLLQAMLPVVAAQALADPAFMNPGAHPLHRLLDAVHDAAVGWQPELGRAGDGLQQDLSELVDRCRSYFDDPDLSFAELAADEEIRLNRAATRAERMIQRLVEKEQGRVRISACRREAALMINRHLQEPLPTTIIDFLKGHWLDSAQLVLLKHGADSEEWRGIQAATERLLDSTRKDGPEGEDRRQHLFKLVSQLPRELKRYLLSLQHDKEAIDDTLGLVEYVHLRLLRDDDIDLEQAEPVALEQDPGIDTAARPAIEEGQWYALSLDEGLVRGRLILDLVEEKHLVFSNLAGSLAASLGYGELEQMMASDRVKHLVTGSTFTHCLTVAASEQPDTATAQVPGESTAPAIAEPQLTADSQDSAGATIMPFPEPELTVDPDAIPIGTWLGFHDGEIPLLARLAVHDPTQDSYIFVNRDGVKLRELSGRELQRLFDDDIVDMLELRAPPRSPPNDKSPGDDEEERA